MRIFAVLSMSALLAARIDAQPTAATEPALQTGTRVRVSTVGAPSTFRIGTVAWASTDTLEVRLADGDTVVAFPHRAIAQLDVSAGRRRKTLQGAGIGALIGAGTGVIMGLASGDDPPGLFSFTAEGKAEFAGAALGLVGLAVGAVVGGNNFTETWQPVHIIPRARLSPDPSFGVRVSLTVR